MSLPHKQTWQLGLKFSAWQETVSDAAEREQETPQKLLLEGSSPGADSLESQRESGLKRGSRDSGRSEKGLLETSKRSLAVLQESLGGAAKGLPVYYRLDHL